jgi:predicted TIM-barrel fold metal-dependent hydrolase
MQHVQRPALGGALVLMLVLAGLCYTTPSALSGNALAQPRATTPRTVPKGDAALFNDSHVHLTDYIQEGVTVRALLATMGARVKRAALFGVPLQQLWSQRVSGDTAPTYYLNADTPLYYYSFTDAQIAMAYRSLSKEQQARFDPMITGFNPADMYAVDHIKRVLRTFPGVFTGIGEFTIHKEFVSSKVAGEVASLQDPALDRVLDFAAESGLLVLIHNDIDVPFAKPGSKPAYLEQMRALLARHPQTTLIWAHTGLGRVIRPVEHHAAVLEALLNEFGNLYLDISWNEVAKYLTATPESLAISAELLTRHPDRFLFGTDEVAPKDPDAYLSVYRQYAPLWAKLDPATSQKIRLSNYERLFDQAARKVRAWERANP